MNEQKFNGKNVFLAFRTDVFEKEDEHMTLKFFGNTPLWEDIMTEARKWQEMLPVRITQNGLAVWKNRDEYHKVALMTFEGHPSLFGRSWHVTLESSVSPIPTETYMEDWAESMMMDTLWVGYKDEGRKKWITYRNAKHLLKGK